jgi:hypothetical protein
LQAAGCDPNAANQDTAKKALKALAEFWLKKNEAGLVKAKAALDKAKKALKDKGVKDEDLCAQSKDPAIQALVQNYVQALVQYYIALACRDATNVMIKLYS